MNIALDAYLKQLTVIELKFRNAQTQSNPALWLFDNDLRTPLFMLEGLSRIHRETISFKKFEKLYQTFKIIEDGLGEIDYYQSFKNYAIKHKLDPLYIQYFDGEYQVALDKFVNILQKENWFDKKGKVGYLKFYKLKNQLSKIKWPSVQKNNKNLAEFFSRKLSKLNNQYRDGKYNFKDLENGVHEFRRRIRWYSIYAHALNGSICLKNNKSIPKSFQKYATAKIIASPFNKLQNDHRIKPLFIDNYLFYALSHVIGRLGKIKDKGQTVEAFEHAAKEMKLLPKNSSHKYIKNLLKDDFIEASEITKQAKQLCNQVIKEDKLLFLLSQSF